MKFNISNANSVAQALENVANFNLCDLLRPEFALETSD